LRSGCGRMWRNEFNQHHTSLHHTPRHATSPHFTTLKHKQQTNKNETAIVKLKSASPYSQSKMRDDQKEDKETHDAYEKRTWIEKGHWNDKGEMFIPPMALKKSIEGAARELAMQIPAAARRHTRPLSRTAFWPSNPSTSASSVNRSAQLDFRKCRWCQRFRQACPTRISNC